MTRCTPALRFGGIPRICGLPVPPLPAFGIALFALSACSSATIPSPEEAARSYAEAAASGDAQAIYGMMTEEARAAYGRNGVERAMADAKKELAARGKEFSEKPLESEARALLVYDDGETAVLSLDTDGFRVSAAGALPAGATTPQQALGELRRALSRRSYALLLGVLSDGSKARFEERLRSLVEALEDPSSTRVEVIGDRATVRLERGHQVTLRREQGVWRVEDFQ